MRPILSTATLVLATGACTGIVAAPDEGAGSSTGVAVCSSGAYWKDADKGSEFMHPGGKCNTCHDKNPMAPNFTVTGTVYPTSHEPDECNGIVNISDIGTSDVTVVITDKSGRSLAPLQVNSVGNFKFEAEVIKPFLAKVVANGKENKMMGTINSGDCNFCHTQMGAEGAPGRITIPK